jgi:hypothetical protein
LFGLKARPVCSGEARIVHIRAGKNMLSRETKFLIDPATAAAIGEWARATLERDPHGEGQFGDQYRTTSLYFDTDDFDVFNRRGSYSRSKYRIRRYDGLSTAFLERKLRTDSILAKRRTSVALTDLAPLGRSIATRRVLSRWVGSWFEHRLLIRRLQPICQISYSRLARIAEAEYGPVRMTLDTHVRALPIDSLEFNERDGQLILPDQAVLELKYRDVLPSVFKRLIEEFRLEPRRASKYRAAVQALDLVQEPATSVRAAAAASVIYAA